MRTRPPAETFSFLAPDASSPARLLSQVQSPGRAGWLGVTLLPCPLFWPHTLRPLSRPQADPGPARIPQRRVTSDQAPHPASLGPHLVGRGWRGSLVTLCWVGPCSLTVERLDPRGQGLCLN